MRRKIHDLRHWTGAIHYTQHLSHHPEFLLLEFVAQQVKQPLEVDFDGEPLQLFGHGHRWIRAHPRVAPAGVVGEALTVLLDVSGRPLQLYIDIHQGGGFDRATGLPWIDDLYLDVVGLFGPGWQPRHLLVVDDDELENAVQQLELTPELAAAVRKRGLDIMQQLQQNCFLPLDVIRKYVESQPR